MDRIVQSDESYVFSGRDKLYGSDKGDHLLGYAGNDTLDGRGAADSLSGATGDDILYGRMGNDRMAGGQGRDALLGGGGNDLLFGMWGKDHLVGGVGKDTLAGGGSADSLKGGSGADTFFFATSAEAGIGATHDTIQDFRHLDTIHLSEIDANVRAAGDQSFHFVWARAFSGTAGELRFADGTLSGDVTGDGVADFSIDVLGEDHIYRSDLIL